MANNASAVVEPTTLTDYFIQENGVSFAGRHLLVDLWNAENLTDIPLYRDIPAQGRRSCRCDGPWRPSASVLGFRRRVGGADPR